MQIREFSFCNLSIRMKNIIQNSYQIIFYQSYNFDSYIIQHIHAFDSKIKITIFFGIFNLQFQQFLNYIVVLQFDIYKYKKQLNLFYILDYYQVLSKGLLGSGEEVGSGFQLQNLMWNKFLDLSKLIIFMMNDLKKLK
ncbi:unnamed protein product [Paramecium octaurelia]|uniref:Uncharacterized protein n=1 Tax=Paramecium octaurelia TaxID=43137 RepID=A0A8S1U9P6_PAROT|nr:unnamed protein product [Paramecium octaurelia]